jgi:putative ATPase
VVESEVGAVAAAVATLDEALRFDRVFGRGALAEVDDPAAWLTTMSGLLTPDGAVLLAETDPARAQRLAPLVDWSDAEELGARVRRAEATLYADAAAWDEGRWRKLAVAAGMTLASTQDVVIHGDQRIAPEAVARWFGRPEAPGSYAHALGAELAPDEIDEVARRYRTHFAGQVVPWRTVVAVGRFVRSG